MVAVLMWMHPAALGSASARPVLLSSCLVSAHSARFRAHRVSRLWRWGPAGRRSDAGRCQKVSNCVKQASEMGSPALALAPTG